MQLDLERVATSVVGLVKTAMVGVVDRLTALEKRIDALPTPKDGAPGPQGEKGLAGDRGEIGPAGPQGERGERGEAGPQGEPGAVGPVGPAGEKGFDGKDGRDGLPGVPGATGEKGLDGKDGRDGLHGKDGADGLGFDDLSVDYDGERTFTLKFQRGDVVKAFPFSMPVVLYRGLYDAATSYEKGDAVTWGGSLWIARGDAASIAPDENSPQGKKTWALSVMRGRQGKQGQKGDIGERGPQGMQGIQGRAGY